LSVNSTAKPLNTIIQIVVDLNVFNFSCMTNTHQGQTIHFVVRTSHFASLCNTHIFDYTTVVGWLITTIKTNCNTAFALYVTYSAFTIACTGITSTVLRSKTLYNHTTPFTQSVEILISSRAESDWAGCSAFCQDFGTECNNQHAIIQTLHVSTWLDGQSSAILFDTSHVSSCNTNVTTTHFYQAIQQPGFVSRQRIVFINCTGQSTNIIFTTYKRQILIVTAVITTSIVI